jgi:hypothetical protein
VVLTLGAFCGLIGTAAVIFIRNPVSFIWLDDDLNTGGLSFATSEIERIVIAPDPKEDYCDEQGLLRRIDIQFRRIAHQRSIGIIATDGDADLMATWAAKFGIDLVDCRTPPSLAEELGA